jgi:hypothetical protein
LPSSKSGARNGRPKIPTVRADTDMELQISWRTVADLPRFLSLTIDEWSYTGGAHGSWGRGSLIWDKKSATEIKPLALFTSNEAFDKVVQTPFCDKLDIERSKKRDGEKVDRSQTDDWMQACPKPSELTVISGIVQWADIQPACDLCGDLFGRALCRG